MAIFTPAGLKIKTSIEDAFTLLARLHPKVRAYYVLQTVEGIQFLPTFFSTITGVLLFIYGVSPLMVVLASVCSYLFGYFYARSGYYPYFLIDICDALSHLERNGIISIALIMLGLLTVWWKITLLFFLGKYAALGITFIWEMPIFNRKPILTFGEVTFYRAYELHSKRIHVKVPGPITEEELQSKSWHKPYAVLAMECPNITEKFTEKPSVCGILEHDQLYYFHIRTN